MRNRQAQVQSARRRPQRGMSIVELMVALGISATLLAGVIGVYVSMFQGDRTQEAVSRIQESGRFALNFLGQEVRTAGYLGCSSTLDRAADINNTLSGIPGSFQPARIIQGWEADNSDPGVINASVNNEAVGTTASGWSTSGANVLDATSAMPGTDVLRVWYADPTNESTVNSVGTPDDDLVINVTNNINAVAGDFLLLSDCDKADLVRVCTSAASTTPANSLNLTLSSTCATGPTYIADRALLTGPGATVQKLAGTVFYVGKRGDTATNVPALFRRTLGTLGTAGTPEELVEGIENMQILYGENIDNDNNNAVDRFVPADQVTNWDKVVSVRIELLVMSLENNLVPAAQPYTYNGIDYTGASGKGALPPDTRLRRVFTTTINLRNITLGG